ncbi:Transposable element tcb1 transposase, partial [Caligus rogercresseyi]
QSPETPISILARKRGVLLSSSVDGLCGLRDPVLHSQQDSAPPATRPNLCSPGEENAQLLGLQHMAPNIHAPEPMRLLLVGEVGEGGLRHSPQQCGVPKAIHQVADEQAVSCG